ncbi:hypothetical protein TNIN_459781 [Trichonephila inaurata madagascariensis]|uniref:Integrase catalytic domain-containing protein n=1 Tax=Trichonephila inaurata madagascariensis TaxID=2747483 RepID=A0A8X6WWD5_9ARAC|nr:hypothetical protein TNIN_459781 [Trichonephila inaurata madagascariensis]
MSAEAVASFIANWISRFGVPAIAQHHRPGGQFLSRLLYSLKQMLGIKRIRTTPYHPSSNGMVERLHRTLGNYSVSRYKMDRVTTSGPAGSASVHQRDLMHPALKWYLEKPLLFQENSLNL